MSSLLRDAKRYLLRPVVKQAAGVLVRYHSIADGNTYDVVATMANSAADAETSEGIQFTEQIKDWKIEVADLPVAPNNLDKIEVLTDEDGQSELGIANQWYQVLSTGGSRAVEPNDQHEDTHLIHTKNIPEPVATQVMHGNAAGDSYGNSAGDGYGSPGS